jgi:hypothetical protein
MDDLTPQDRMERHSLRTQRQVRRVRRRGRMRDRLTSLALVRMLRWEVSNQVGNNIPARHLQRLEAMDTLVSQQQQQHSRRMVCLNSNRHSQLRIRTQMHNLLNHNTDNPSMERLKAATNLQARAINLLLRSLEWEESPSSSNR